MHASQQELWPTNQSQYKSNIMNRHENWSPTFAHTFRCARSKYHGGRRSEEHARTPLRKRVIILHSKDRKEHLKFLPSSRTRRVNDAPAGKNDPSNNPFTEFIISFLHLVYSNNTNFTSLSPLLFFRFVHLTLPFPSRFALFAFDVLSSANSLSFPPSSYSPPHPATSSFL